jgi:hypothetical protein
LPVSLFEFNISGNLKGLPYGVRDNCAIFDDLILIRCPVEEEIDLNPLLER